MNDLVVGDDGHARCSWSGGDPLYDEYHDREWGRATTSDVRLFEKIVLEGFQAGLSWITILRKRDRFREVFRGFDPETVADFEETDVSALLADAGIIRHRGKIEAAINNAERALEIIDEFGSMAAYVWPQAPPRPSKPRSFADVPNLTDESTALSKDLKRRGWKFVGPTTIYAFMQAMGLVNDHLQGCWVREECEQLRIAATEQF